MKKAAEIHEYLAALADELVIRGVNQLHHILISGGAFIGSRGA